MSKQIDALKLAFEALKENQHLVADNERHAYVMEYNSIIEKCEEALAEPEQKPVAWATKDDFYRELERELKRMREEMKIKSVTMRCKDYDIALPIIGTDFGRVLVGQVSTPPQPKEPEQEPEFIQHEVESAEDWSEWVCPNPHKYLMKCCDCGLVHEAEFGVVRYKSETEREDCEPVNDPNLQAVFRMRRSEQWSPEDTAHRAGGLPMAQPKQEQGEPVAWIHNFIDGGISIGKRPADLNRHPDRWTALYKEPKPCPTCEALARTVMLDQTSHDTTPPQRTWVGLDEEDDIDWEEGGSLRDLVKAVEAKLRSKNNV